MRSFEKRDYSRFDAIEPSRYAEALNLGTDAPYFIALHLLSAGREADACLMFAVGEASSPEPYASLCSEELSRRGTPEVRLASVNRLLELKPDSEKLRESRDRLYVLSGAFNKVPGGIEPWLSAHVLDEELVKSIRSRSVEFSAAFAPIFAVRANVAQRIYGPAWADAKVLIESGAPIWRRQILTDVGKAALYGSTVPEKSADLVSSLSVPASAEKADPGLRFLTVFYAARMYERAEKNDKAKGAYIRALALSANGSDRDSALWYLWNLDLKKSTSLFVEDFVAQAATWDNPDWFADILETAVVRLVQERKWADLDRIRIALPENARSALKARLAYISAMTVHAETGSAGSILASASAPDNGSLYYRIMAAAASGANVTAGTSESPGAKTDGGEVSISAREDPRGDVLRGYLRWYLPELLYRATVDLYPEIPVNDAVELAGELERQGQYADGIRLVSLALGGPGGNGPREALELLYPRPWQAEVSAAAARYGIPEYLLFALIRSESLFQPSVVSEAGARGLAQLMRPTAKDLAGRMGLGSFDIDDPATNISIGAFYLSFLLPRFDGDYLSCFYAYNAGMTRVREWLKAAEGLAPEIRLEGLPYAETRDYGRKILSAAAMYGSLYYEKSWSDVVGELFPAKHAP
jgi:soluble lytic murein transglycosylase